MHHKYAMSSPSCLMIGRLNLLQINPDKSREEFHAAGQKHGGSDIKKFMDSLGLGMLAEQVRTST